MWAIQGNKRYLAAPTRGGWMARSSRAMTSLEWSREIRRHRLSRFQL
jgi:hypothetical protein